MNYTTIDDVRGDARIDTRDLIELRAMARDEILECRLIQVAGEVDETDDLEAIVEAIDALEGEGIEDFEHGAQMIREDDFEEYARELADDIGAVPAEHTWPTSYIDWTRAAAELAMDYSSVSFLGHDYYVR